MILITIFAYRNQKGEKMKQHKFIIIASFGLFFAGWFIPLSVYAIEGIQQFHQTVDDLQGQYSIALKDYNNFLSRSDVHNSLSNSNCGKLSQQEKQRNQKSSRLVYLKQIKEDKLRQLQRKLSFAREQLHKKQMSIEAPHHQIIKKRK